MPALEPLHRFANRPYTVFGQDFVPAISLRPYKESGIASWYGRKFHGQKTSIGETYDMYAMTAAHPTLPLPSYARVTNVTTGKTVVVRVNDRGPFLHDRIIDLSYAAAHRLGIAAQGSGEVEVEAIIPGDAPVFAAARAAAAGARRRGRGADHAPRCRPRAAAGARRATPAGFAVQLGAFQNYVNAQNFLTHVQSQLAVGAGRAQDARAQRTVSRLRWTVCGPRRGAAGGGAHHAGIRHGDGGGAALTPAEQTRDGVVNPAFEARSL